MLLSFLFGGIIYGVKLMASSEKTNLPLLLLFLLLPVCVGGVCFLSGVFAKRRAMPECAALTITLGEKSVRIPMLVDTGNGLYDPISGTPVIVVEHKALAPLFLKTKREGSFKALGSQSYDTLPDGFRLIAVNSAVSASSLMPVFRPDSAKEEVNGGGFSP